MFVTRNDIFVMFASTQYNLITFQYEKFHPPFRFPKRKGRRPSGDLSIEAFRGQRCTLWSSNMDSRHDMAIWKTNHLVIFKFSIFESWITRCRVMFGWRLRHVFFFFFCRWCLLTGDRSGLTLVLAFSSSKNVFCWSCQAVMIMYTGWKHVKEIGDFRGHE